ncbi:MAG: 3-hydroxyacyl-CoA dehydrogenase NAD-binding domain-containing protein, partial [Candidatus Aminicenantales bacterium]
MNRTGRTEASEMRTLTWDEVEILIVGAGTMGASLTQAYAQSGFAVGVVDISDQILERARATIDAELGSALKAGIFTQDQVEEIRGRILMTTRYEEACSGTSLKLVIETATENIEIKKEIFRTLDRLCAPEVVIASNSSSLDTNILARETRRPDKVVWMHYFYLPHKNRAGEVAGTDTASPESVALAAKYMKLAGKLATPILSSRKGGAADVIFVALLLEATRMVDEGFDIPSIEAAGRAAFNMPVGFLGLMDATGLPLGIATMFSFSDASNPDDPLYRVYRNFFTPPSSYRKKLEEYEKAEDKSRVKWVPEDQAGKEPKDPAAVERLKERFLAVGFMTACEVVEAGVIALEDVDRLCRNAFLWREGPFFLMNRVGVEEALRMVQEREALARSQKIHFPVPRILVDQAKKKEPWPLVLSPVVLSREMQDRVARIMLSNPQAANALDNRVFDDLSALFQKAYEDDRVGVVVFDTAPIKTFIAGANVPDFIANIRKGNFSGIRENTAMWQDVLFHRMTGSGKPKVAIVSSGDEIV